MSLLLDARNKDRENLYINGSLVQNTNLVTIRDTVQNPPFNLPIIPPSSFTYPYYLSNYDGISVTCTGTGNPFGYVSIVYIASTDPFSIQINVSSSSLSTSQFTIRVFLGLDHTFYHDIVSDSNGKLPTTTYFFHADSPYLYIYDGQS
jgi:hypothetical protein